MKDKTTLFSEIRILLDARENLPVVAIKLNIPLDFVLREIMEAHGRGDYDLIGWINENIRKEYLISGCEYFKKVNNPCVKECRAVLMNDEYTAELCKFYVENTIT